MSTRRVFGVALSLTDAGSAAAASFFAGIIALRTLNTDELAFYALLFPAAIAIMLVPQTIVYLPQRLLINASEQAQRPAYGADAARGAIVAAAAGVILLGAGLPLIDSIGIQHYWAMTAGAIAWVLTSPFQDHVRAALHISGRHLSAAAVSVTNLVITGGALAIVSVIDITDAPYVSYAVLAAGNLLSSPVGILLHRGVGKAQTRVPVTLRNASRYSASALVMQAGGYFNNLLVAVMLVPAALADLESARVAAQPVLVLGIGLSSYFLPIAVRNRAAGATARARRVTLAFAGAAVGGGLAYSAALPFVAPALSSLAQRAIDVPLAILRAVSFSLQSTSAPLNNLNLSAGLYRRAFWNSASTTALALGLNFALIPMLGVFALPISLSIAAIARFALGMRDLSSRQPAED